MAKRRIGEILLAAGKVTQEQLDKAQEVQKGNPNLHRRMGMILYSLGFIELGDIVDAIKQQQQETPRLAVSERAGKLLGELLVESGLISQSELDFALQVQKHSDRKIGEILCDLGYITPEELVDGLLTQVGVNIFKD